jgi:DMSO/TMAO reductase YedYZ heme-binding membrane subunit
MLMMVLLWLGPDGSLADELGYALRVSARLAFIALLLAYVARPWHTLTGRGRWLILYRRYFGLAAALVHTVHFAYIVALFALTEAVLEAVTAIFGGFAYLCIWVMALSSNRASQQRLRRWWSRLHRFGMHYLWLVFMQAFVGIALTAGDPIYVALTVAGVLAFMLRAAAAMRHRLRRTA